MSERSMLGHKPVREAPDAEGMWADKGFSHDTLQLNVSDHERAGGANSHAGCLHDNATRSREKAFERYFALHTIPSRTSHLPKDPEEKQWTI